MNIPTVDIHGCYYFDVHFVSINGNKSLISIPPSKFITDEKFNVLGKYGARKCFMEIEGDRGVRIYRQMEEHLNLSLSGTSFAYTEDQSYLDYNLSLMLSKLGFHPFPEICYVKMSVDLRSSDYKNKNSIHGKFWGLLCDVIHSPPLILDFSKANHRAFYDKIKNDRKVSVLDFPVKDIFGEKIADENPKFTKKHYVSFKKKMAKLYKLDSRFKKLRCQNPGRKRKNPDTKYTNVLYCCKQKSWYWIDLD